MSRYAESISEHHRSPNTSAIDHLATDAGNGFLLVARLLIGAVFLLTGAMKLMDINHFALELTMMGAPSPHLLAIFGALVEFICGLAIVLGLQVRLAALVLVAFTIVATLMAHRF